MRVIAAAAASCQLLIMSGTACGYSLRYYLQGHAQACAASVPRQMHPRGLPRAPTGDRAHGHGSWPKFFANPVWRRREHPTGLAAESH